MATYYKKIDNKYIIQPNAEKKVRQRFSNPEITDFETLGYLLYVAAEKTEYQVFDGIKKVAYKKEVTDIVRDMTISEKETYIKNRDFNGKDIKIIADYPWIVRNLTGLATEAQTNPNIDWFVNEDTEPKVATVFLDVIDDDVLAILNAYPDQIQVVYFADYMEGVIV